LLQKDALQARREHLRQDHVREPRFGFCREEKAGQLGSVRNHENWFPRSWCWLTSRLIYKILQYFCHLTVPLARFLSCHFHRNRKEFLIVATNMAFEEGDHLAGIGHTQG
jgi:hypothetical protein